MPVFETGAFNHSATLPIYFSSKFYTFIEFLAILAYPISIAGRWDGRVVYGGSLENYYRRNPIEGSNPSPTANNASNTPLCGEGSG